MYILRSLSSCGHPLKKHKRKKNSFKDERIIKFLQSAVNTKEYISRFCLSGLKDHDYMDLAHKANIPFTLILFMLSSLRHGFVKLLAKVLKLILMFYLGNSVEDSFTFDNSICNSTIKSGNYFLCTFDITSLQENVHL